MQQLKTTIKNFGDGIYAIDQQMVRAFLIVGESRAVLMDTGAVRVDILSSIKQITDLPLTVLLSHGDGDHIGNLSAFGSAYCHTGDHDAVLSHEDCRSVRLLPLCEGDTFDVGGRTLSVLFTPGHTKGSVCFLDEKNKILFAGDTVSYGPVFMFGERRNAIEYLVSLKRLQAMRNDGVFETVFCCHNACPIPAGTVDELIACVEGYQNRTITGIPAPMPVPSADKPFLYKYGPCMLLADELQ